MHVIHIIESFAAGSLTALSTLCANVQGEIRHSVIHSLRPETPADFQNLFPTTTQFHYVPMCRNVHPCNDFRAYVAILNILKRSQPDIVHCHSSKAGVLGRLAALHLGTPSVYTPHGYSFLRTDISPLLRSVYKGIEYSMARLGTATCACGEEEFALAQALLPAPKSTYLIENCIHVSTQPPVTTSSAIKKSLQVGTLGRVAHQRNPQLFSAVAKSLQDAAQWIWIGASLEGVEVLSPHIRRTGWVNHKSAMAYVDNLDIYIQTSLWEGLSYSILEAMSRGKVVVATNIQANRSIIQHGVTGFLGNNQQDIETYIRMLLADSKLRETMGKAAREHVLAHHNAPTVYAAYSTIYKAIAATRKH